jgi:hypothetical protein
VTITIGVPSRFSAASSASPTLSGFLGDSLLIWAILPPGAIRAA